MQTTNFWNLYYLSSHKIVLTLVFSLFWIYSGLCQNAIATHDAKKNENGYSYGIHLAVTNQNFRIERSDVLLDNEEGIQAVNGKTEPGVSVGIIGALHPSERSEFRATALVNFNNQNLVYIVEDAEKKILYQGGSTSFELPIHYKYKSKPYGNFRMFLIGGGRFRTNFDADKKLDQTNQTVQLTKSDLMFDVGAGAEIHFPFFTLSPTFTISQGFKNQRQANPDFPFTNVLSGLYSRVYTLGFNIE